MEGKWKRWTTLKKTEVFEYENHQKRKYFSFISSAWLLGSGLKFFFYLKSYRCLFYSTFNSVLINAKSCAHKNKDHYPILLRLELNYPACQLWRVLLSEKIFSELRPTVQKYLRIKLLTIPRRVVEEPVASPSIVHENHYYNAQSETSWK